MWEIAAGREGNAAHGRSECIIMHKDVRASSRLPRRPARPGRARFAAIGKDRRRAGIFTQAKAEGNSTDGRAPCTAAFRRCRKPSWPGASQIERRPARARPAANRRSGNGDVFGGRADEDVPALRAWCVRAFFCYAAPWAWAPAPRAWCAPPRVPPSAVETVPAPRVACPTKGSTQRRGNHPCAARVVRPTKGSARRRGSRPCAARGAPVNRRRCGDVFGGGADEAVPAPRVGAPSTGEVATATFLAEGPMKMSLRCARGAFALFSAMRPHGRGPLRCARGAPHQGFRPAPWKPSLRRAWRARQPAKMRRRFRRRGR